MAVMAAIVAALLAVVAWREVVARRTIASLTRKLREKEADRDARERLATVGELISGLAQELKSPLQGVIGNTELILATPHGHEEAEGLREIQENAARAAGIVRNLLAFTEPGALKRRWLDVNDLVSEAVGECRAELDAAGARVEMKPAERLPLVYVDGRQLEKVVATMLVGPAASPHRSMRDRPPISIVTRRAAGSDDRLIVELNHQVDAVTDHEVWSGDVAACRRVLEAHGGALVVDEEEGGVRCRLELPVTAVGAAAGGV